MPTRFCGDVGGRTRVCHGHLRLSFEAVKCNPGPRQCLRRLPRPLPGRRS